MATIGRPAGIRREIVSKPGAAIEVTVFHFPANIVKPEPVQIERHRLNILKAIRRMIIQIMNLIFHRGKCKLHAASLPAPTVSFVGPNPGTFDPGVVVTSDAERDGNIFELYRSENADMSGQVKIAELTISPFTPAFHDNLTVPPNDYYYRARERTADSVTIGPYSAIVHYVVA